MDKNKTYSIIQNVNKINIHFRLISSKTNYSKDFIVLVFVILSFMFYCELQSHRKKYH